MKKVHLLISAAALLCLAACKKNSDTPAPAGPVITGLVPTHGGYNSIVTIKGLHFGDAADKTVKINDLMVPVTSATDTSVTIQVPLKAGDGRISLTTLGQTVESVDTFLYDYGVTVGSFAGDGNAGYLDGAGAAARLYSPMGMTIDAQDNLYVADQINYCIRKITPGGLVSTFSGKPGTAGYADGTGNTVLFGAVQDIKYEKTEGAFYVLDTYNAISRVRKIAPGGQVSTIAGGGTNTDETVSNPLDAQLTHTHYYDILGLVIDANKNIYVADDDGGYIRKINSSGITTLAGRRGVMGYQDGQGTNALFHASRYLATAVDGNLLLIDAGNNRIRKVTLSGLVTSFAGDGNSIHADADTPPAASFRYMSAITQDSKGNTYVMDDDRLRVITSRGRVISLTNNSYGYSNGDGNAAKFDTPQGMVIDSHDNLFISDTYNNRIRKVVIQ